MFLFIRPILLGIYLITQREVCVIKPSSLSPHWHVQDYKHDHLDTKYICKQHTYKKLRTWWAWSRKHKYTSWEISIVWDFRDLFVSQPYWDGWVNSLQRVRTLIWHSSRLIVNIWFIKSILVRVFIPYLVVIA